MFHTCVSVGIIHVGSVCELCLSYTLLTFNRVTSFLTGMDTDYRTNESGPYKLLYGYMTNDISRKHY